MAIPTARSLPRRSKWAEAGLATVGAIGVVVGASDSSIGAPIPEGSLLIGLPLLAVAMWLYRRTLPILPFTVSAVLVGLSPAVTVGMIVMSYAVGRYEPRWPVRIAAAVLGMLALAVPVQAPTVDLVVGGIVGGAFAVLLPGVVGIWVRTRAELLGALRERAERAEAERELLARDAVLTERTRIAREMHDAVGHRVSLMVLQAGAIEMAAGDAQRVSTLAGQVQVAGRQALDELRQAVGVLRSGDQDDAPLAPQPGLDDLERLVKECRTAGMAVELHQAGPVAVDPVTSRAAYRIVQEALTNAGKHAPGAPVSVHVDRVGRELVVRVRNGGSAPVHDAPGGGFGLIGLRERVRTLDGRFRAEPRLDGGFEVEAGLPTSGQEREHRSEERARSGAPRGSEP